MSRWTRKVWEPNETVSEYEQLHILARKRGVYVRLRREGSRLVELGLSNGLGVHLASIDDLERAARKLRRRLEESR